MEPDCHQINVLKHNPAVTFIFKEKKQIRRMIWKLFKKYLGFDLDYIEEIGVHIRFNSEKMDIL
jgi:hypothetical protein